MWVGAHVIATLWKGVLMAKREAPGVISTLDSHPPPPPQKTELIKMSWGFFPTLSGETGH